MSVLAKLREKPWLVQPEGMDPSLLPSDEVPWPARTALKFLLATISVVFSLFVMTMLGRSQMPDYQALAGEPWLPLTNSGGLWLSSALLLLSSVAMQLAYELTKRQRMQAALFSVTAAAVLVLLFFAAQYLVWLQMSAAGFGFTDTAASNYFYLLTAIHALHLLGGLLALSVVYQRFARQTETPLLRSLHLSCWYWHYLLLVWLLLFALLTSSADTINTLAALCGFGEGSL